MGLNKINYKIDPETLSKALKQDAKALSGWKKYQTVDNTEFDSTKPYFVVLRNGEGAIDFDIITREKLDEDVQRKRKKYNTLKAEIRQRILTNGEFPPVIETVKAFLSHWGLPTTGYFVETGTGGIHYYLKYDQSLELRNTSGLIFTENLCIDFRGSGGLLYGVGTKWLDRPQPYRVLEGTESEIPLIPKLDIWRIVGATGLLERYVMEYHLGEFILGNLDPHKIANKHEFIIWREALYLLKEMGYSGIEIEQIFSHINGYKHEVCLPQIKAYWDRELDPRRVKYREEPFTLQSSPKPKVSIDEVIPPTQQAEIGETPTPQIEYFYSFTIAEGKVACLDQTGVYMAPNPTVPRMEIYHWDSFRITSKLKQNTDKRVIVTFDGELNGTEFKTMDFKELRRMLKEECLCNDRGANCITPLLQQYIADVEDITDKLKPHLGFMENGWCLPPENKFRFEEDEMKETLGEIEGLMKIKAEKVKAVEYFSKIYEHTSIKKKDILYAVFFVQPFMHVLKQICSVMPMLLLNAGQDKAKSSISTIAVRKIWKCGRDLLNRDVIKSESRFMGSLSGSTFPTFLDDCEHFPEKSVDTLRTHLTKNAPFKRKSGQKLIINTILLSPIASSFNNFPEFIRDPAMRDRILFFTVELEYVVAYWEQIMLEIPDGYIGKYIVDCTKNWDMNTLIELYNKMEVPDTMRSSRSQKMYRIIKIGQYIAKTFLDLELDLSSLDEMLNISKTVGLESLIDGVKHMAIKGCSNIDERFQFHPTDWVKQPTICREYNGVHGILIDTQRKNELFEQYADIFSARKLTKQNLYEILHDVWPSVKYDIFSVQGVSDRVIFIPSEYLIQLNCNLRNYVNADEKSQEAKTLLYAEIVPPTE